MKHLISALLFLVVSLTGTVLLAQPASALTPAPTVVAGGLKSDACSGLNQIDSTQGCNTSGSQLTNTVKAIVRIISYIAGVAAIIMIIVAGLRYITSGGDSGKVSSAKSALIYALIGVLIAALAQALVHFALHTANSVS